VFVTPRELRARIDVVCSRSGVVDEMRADRLSLRIIPLRGGGGGGGVGQRGAVPVAATERAGWPAVTVWLAGGV